MFVSRFRSLKAQDAVKVAKVQLNQKISAAKQYAPEANPRTYRTVRFVIHEGHAQKFQPLTYSAHPHKEAVLARCDAALYAMSSFPLAQRPHFIL